MAIEKPAYTVIDVGDGFEVREYPPYVLATTRVQGPFDDAGNEGFRRLLRYISGANRGSRKIAMTAPVGQRAGEKIAMTAPVSQRGSDDAWLVSFVMPASYSLETLPRPLDPRIALEPVPARRVAALRYSGRWTEGRYQRYRDRLETALAAAGLVASGAPELARYDPPFMPWSFRRNEILIPVTGPAHRASR